VVTVVVVVGSGHGKQRYIVVASLVLSHQPFRARQDDRVSSLSAARVLMSAGALEQIMVIRARHNED
jgi:hypothetical protein